MARIDTAALAEKIRAGCNRLMLSRPFFGLLLLKTKFGLDTSCKTAYTDGKNIRFSPSFLASLTPSEVDFVLCHEILHIVLGHCFRSQSFQEERFNKACDIVINSIILHENYDDLSSISIHRKSAYPHTTPNGRPGYLYTAEQVYFMLPPKQTRDYPVKRKVNKFGPSDPLGATEDQIKKSISDGMEGTLDDHSHWGTVAEGTQEEWEENVQEALQASEAMGLHRQHGCGLSPALKKFLIGCETAPKLNWKEILSAFIQEEVTDYTLVPPDKRFQDDFFLPDFSDKSDTVKDILFMVDTSGSMSDEDIGEVYSEIVGAIDQFGGRLRGWLGFFDAAVVPPKPFDDIQSFRLIKAAGRGGTSYEPIFNYVDKYMETKPSSIVILTDGYASWPDEKMAKGIPVLWIINNNEATPKWGKTVRLIP